jgi:hypothetical protein
LHGNNNTATVTGSGTPSNPNLAQAGYGNNNTATVTGDGLPPAVAEGESQSATQP